MELDELKKELNIQMTAGHRRRSSGQFAELLQGNTISIVQKVRRSVQVEICIAMFFAAISLYVIMFSNSWQYQVLFGIFGVLAVAFILTLYLLHRKINNLPGNVPVKRNLQTLIGIMESYVKKYLQFTLFLLPVCFGLGVWLSYNDPAQVLKPLTMKTIWLLTGIMTGLGAILYVFTKWYLEKMYGNYTRKLKTLLTEFEAE